MFRMRIKAGKAGQMPIAALTVCSIFTTPGETRPADHQFAQDITWALCFQDPQLSRKLFIPDYMQPLLPRGKGVVPSLKKPLDNVRIFAGNLARPQKAVFNTTLLHRVLFREHKHNHTS